MTNNTRSDNRAGPIGFPEKDQAIGSIGGEDRIKALLYIFKKALEAGKKDGEFDMQAAINGLENGRLQLRGTQDQIAGQLLLIRGATALLKRTFNYEVIDGTQALTLPSDEAQPRPQPISNANAPGVRR